jgi:chromosome segregation ATPase
MKNLIVIFFCFLISLSLSAQGVDFVSKQDFEKEKNLLNDKIRAAKAPTFELRALYQTQQELIDSLFTGVADIHRTSEQDREKLGDLTTRVSKTEEELLILRQALKLRFTWIIVLLALTFLVSLLFLYLMWGRIQKRITCLETDQEKTNEALNLHIRNAEEEIAALQAAMKELTEAVEKKLQVHLQQSESRFQLISDEIAEEGKKADEKIQANKSSIMRITDELEQRTTQLASSGNELKVFLEKVLGELNSKTRNLEEQLKNLKSLAEEGDQKLGLSIADLAKKQAANQQELEKKIQDILDSAIKTHEKKPHGK